MVAQVIVAPYESSRLIGNHNVVFFSPKDFWRIKNMYIAGVTSEGWIHLLPINNTGGREVECIG